MMICAAHATPPNSPPKKKDDVGGAKKEIEYSASLFNLPREIEVLCFPLFRRMKRDRFLSFLLWESGVG